MADVVSLSGEKYNHEVAAVFGAGEPAEKAAREVREALELRAVQVEVLHPGDKALGRSLEPESRGIFETLVRAHFWLGVAGAMAGFLLYLLLSFTGLPMVTNSPVIAGVVMVGFGAVIGLMLGGLVTLRPDHDPYIFRVRAAVRDGQSAVLVHGASLEQRKAAEDELGRLGGDVIHSV
ncbi:MAG TPA: hypothetical protein VKA17_01785 [Gammaproteobacteria bacterium]|nr:hypothetical protein [Gammaproteobacteria bacterium]